LDDVDVRVIRAAHPVGTYSLLTEAWRHSMQTLAAPVYDELALTAAGCPGAPVSPVQDLRRAQDAFIARWAKMARTWGINLTMGEIFAYLYVTGQAKCTDDVMARLNISRGNASVSLRALCSWGVIRRTHRAGERRKYFESLGDVWEIFSIIAAERKRRELDPVLETIRHCRQMLEEATTGEPVMAVGPFRIARQRLADLEGFIQVTNKVFQQFVGDARSSPARVRWRRRGRLTHPDEPGAAAIGRGCPPATPGEVGRKRVAH
jgi:DNA-binding transcriptional regulator GbsR (MarR family)